MTGVVIEVPTQYGPEPIWINLDDPWLTPDAAALAACDRGRVLLRSAQTRREMLAELPEAQRERREDEARHLHLDLDAHDEITVNAVRRYHADESRDRSRYKPRGNENPTSYLNRLASSVIPAGYHPVPPDPDQPRPDGHDWAPILYADTPPQWGLGADNRPVLGAVWLRPMPSPPVTTHTLDLPDKPPF